MTLATIQKIEKINPIPNADNIEVAKVLGWEIVVRSLDQTVSFKVINNEFLLKYGE